MTEAVARQCGQCGNDISNEEIANRQAGLVAGVLLCPACVELKRKEMLEQHRAAAAAAAAATPAGMAVPHDIMADKIALADDEPPAAGQAVRKIRSFAEGSSLGGTHHEVDLKRGLAAKEAPATRCRTFHSKLTPAALAHMDDLINEWIDHNEGVYIKNMAMTVGMFEAKLHPEPHLVLTVFY